ncbi:helix-turn-helix domain-containing protein [Parahaliea sp. F7430]|uniref:Helix-turn-helix domain-containing protein n=2 Tax=Sediminihaliea albiluteola TaxID=2758564 RepID=A0A7W2TUD1_9GAMM|nr:helix-turn-helix domain-containing protein [Sediminihaliea albiluteola]
MANPHQAFGLTEMTRRLNLNKATCHAILTTMANYGFLVQHPKTKAYRLGPSIIAAGNAAFAQFPVLEYARPELEGLQHDFPVGFAVTARSKLHQVLLALYGHATPLIDSFQLGLRLPNTAPIAACFTAFSPAKALEAWLTRAHETRGGYNERLDQKLRVSVIAIRARGYEVTLKTQAEAELTEELTRIQENWSLSELENATNKYQHSLCDEQYHLDRIDPKARYDVATISVPVFVYRDTPVMCFVAGSIEKPITGAQIEEIAARMKESADRVTALASGQQNI